MASPRRVFHIERLSLDGRCESISWPSSVADVLTTLGQWLYLDAIPMGTFDDLIQGESWTGPRERLPNGDKYRVTRLLSADAEAQAHWAAIRTGPLYDPRDS